jgi:DNA polymerase-3 subunit epsilon
MAQGHDARRPCLHHQAVSIKELIAQVRALLAFRMNARMAAKTRVNYRFALILALAFALEAAVIGAVALFVLLDMEEAQRGLIVHALAQRSLLLSALALLLLLALGFGLNVLFRAYLLPLSRLGEDALLLAANPGHRAAPDGAREVRDLAGKFNALAFAHQSLRDDVQRNIESANRALAEEKNRLAALISELALGVLVCTIEGRILLYNARARQLFEDGHARIGSAIGLGRSVFGVIERGLIVHALEQVQHQFQAGETAPPVSRFLATLAAGRVVRVQMAPVLDAVHALVGFVLTMEDISRNIEADSRRDALLQSLTEDTQAALANIRAAAEAMRNFPDMSGAQRAGFAAVIDEESRRLSRQIDRAAEQHGAGLDSQWQLEEMRGADLIALLLRRLHAPSLPAVAGTVDESAWLRVDSYALTQALSHLVHRLVAEPGVKELGIRLQRAGHMACLDLAWTGAPLPAQTLQLWENAPMQLAAGAALTPGAVVKRHGGESVYRPGSARSESVYRLLLPLSEPQVAIAIPPRQHDRPEFYDFDLFHQPGQNPELDQSLLARLSYTVFDIETTGLQPAAGDGIVSIGALRIVNGRLLQQESFDQLVKPPCAMSAESTRIHGITDAMLEDQPPIEKVLPQFYRFAEDSVLVAHNAAFDMRFLQLQEARTGVRFTQPVLDTLLLSQVIHPHQPQHALEAIAARLGVTVIGRHTALGDAIVTGEVFLKMIPLLAANGIRTLKEAREAARQTLYARIEY